jgi:hypothetical protein
MIQRLLIIFIYFTGVNNSTAGQGQATLVVTGSVHGQLDPCG